MKQPLSLKGRALALLAQREQSELELRRKLARHARAARVETAGLDPAPRVREVESVAPKVDEVIAWLRENDYLNESRFIETRVHARASRFGSLRIQRELAEHGLSLSGDASRSLRATEPARAAEVWQRKFGHPPADRTEQARQMRFLIARGFAPDVVRRLVRFAPVGGRSRPEDGAEPD